MQNMSDNCQTQLSHEATHILPSGELWVHIVSIFEKLIYN